LRVLLTRHAQSANKTRAESEAASSDPGLSEQGSQQAALLGDALSTELRHCVPGGLIVVSSPMRRCMLTVLPAIRLLDLPQEDCICHGAAFEFGCAGKACPGSTPEEVQAQLPFRCEGFGPFGWDYQGGSAKETEPEARLRIERLVHWLAAEAVPTLQRRQGAADRTLLICMHQTILDLLVQYLVDGTGERWRYGEIRYKLQNAGITELSIGPDGAIHIVRKNDGRHLHPGAH